MTVKNRTKTTADKKENLSGKVYETSGSQQKSYGKPELKELKKPERKKINKIGLTIKLALVVFAVYAIITLLNQHIEILEKQQTLDELESKIMLQEIKIEEIQKVKDYSDEENAEYMEQIARKELDYVKNGERVFVNVTGS